MQSDFELMEYARERKLALRKNAYILVASGIVLVSLIQLKVVVGWMTLLVVVLVFVLGIVQPIVYRLKHHPFRAEPKEKRFARALLIGCTVGFLCIFAGSVMTGFDSERVVEAGRLCMVFGVGFFMLPIFFNYKTR